MKLIDLGLAQKPQTHYFEGGYVSFQTRDNELSYKIFRVIKTSTVLMFIGKVSFKEEYEELMKIQNLNDVLGVQAQ